MIIDTYDLNGMCGIVMVTKEGKRFAMGFTAKEAIEIGENLLSIARDMNVNQRRP